MHLPEQNTIEWLEMRRNKIGASDAPVILGVSPWKSPYQLWQEKLGLIKAPKANKAMERGLELEKKARQEFAVLTGLFMVPQVMEHPTETWMVASLDGIDEKRQHIVEIKCPGRDDHQTAVEGKIPDKYIPQLQHQLAVTGLPMAFYYSFDGHSGCLVEVQRDDVYINQMMKEELKFYRCIENFEAPSLTDLDYIEKDDAEWMQATASWLIIHNQLEALQSQEKALRDKLIAMAGESNCRGGGVQMTRSMRKGNVDYKSIPQLKGIDLEPYRKAPIETWRITAA